MSNRNSGIRKKTDPKWVVRESLTKTIRNERQMMMTKMTEGRGPSVQYVILLTSAGRWMNVLIVDWLTGNGY